jgi:hypothetical protein
MNVETNSEYVDDAVAIFLKGSKIFVFCNNYNGKVLTCIVSFLLQKFTSTANATTISASTSQLHSLISLIFERISHVKVFHFILQGERVSFC